MQRIFKYTLDTSGKMFLPKGAQVLTVQTQGDKGPMLWAIVDDEEEEEEYRRFEIYGTGHQLNIGENDRYLGTFQLDGGNLVFHVFEVSPV